MAKAAKLLDRMRNNPQDNFRIEDFETVCRGLQQYGVRLLAPSGGSHFKIAYPAGILTVPARKPIKPVYVRKFVDIVDGIIGPQQE